MRIDDETDCANDLQCFFLFFLLFMCSFCRCKFNFSFDSGRQKEEAIKKRKISPFSCCFGF